MMMVLNFLKRVSRFLTLGRSLVLALILVCGSVIHNISTSDEPTTVLFVCLVLTEIVLINGGLREIFAQNKEKEQKND